MTRTVASTFLIHTTRTVLYLPSLYKQLQQFCIYLPYTYHKNSFASNFLIHQTRIDLLKLNMIKWVKQLF